MKPFVPVKTPLVVKSIFPSYVWDMPSNDKVIYLTFDDGPTPEITDWTLDLLEQYNAKATFFCIGNNVTQYPELFNRTIVSGHSIGNHTYHHLKGWKTNTEAYLEDVERARAVFQEFLPKQEKLKLDKHFEGENQKSSFENLFRPPYGKLTPKQGKALQKLGYKIIMWDVLSLDWDTSVTNHVCYDNVISKAKSGSIVVFHDSEKAKARLQYALPKVLDYFSSKGFKFKALSF